MHFSTFWNNVLRKQRFLRLLNCVKVRSSNENKTKMICSKTIIFYFARKLKSVICLENKYLFIQLPCVFPGYFFLNCRAVSGEEGATVPSPPPLVQRLWVHIPNLWLFNRSFGFFLHFLAFQTNKYYETTI